jgi:hypothetical protein
VAVLLAAWLGSAAAFANDVAPNGPEVISGGASEESGYTVAGAKGATYRLRGGFRVELAPATALRFERPTKLQLSTNASTPTQVIELRSGRVDIQCPNQTSVGQALMVSTPKKVMGVFTTGEGTVLASDQRVTVASRKGGTLVGVGNHWYPLPEGYARTISPDDRAAKPRPLLAAPRVDPQSALVLSVERAASPLRLRWQPVPGAARYQVSFGRPSEGVQEIATDRPEVELSTVKPGQYTVTMRALDQEGLAGTPAAARTIRIVGISLPAGAYLGADGDIRLGGAERVRLRGAEGLVMAYGQTDRFGPVPESLGLFRGRAVEVRLRDPASASELRVRVVPTLDHATITFQPIQPQWPAEPVAVKVELFDGNHQPIPRAAKVAVDLRINSRKLTPEWVRHGNVLAANVSPPTPIGPWAVRVEVARPGGEVIARSAFTVTEH